MLVCCTSGSAYRRKSWRQRCESNFRCFTSADKMDSYCRILHRRRPSHQRRSKSSTKLGYRMCMSTGRYRGCRNWVPEDDGRKHPARRTTPTSTTAIGSWKDRFPSSSIISLQLFECLGTLGSSVTNGPEQHSTLSILCQRGIGLCIFYGASIAPSYLFCIAGWCTYRFLEWVEVTNQLIHDRRQICSLD